MHFVMMVVDSKQWFMIGKGRTQTLSLQDATLIQKDLNKNANIRSMDLNVQTATSLAEPGSESYF